MKDTVFISHSVKDNDQEVANLVYAYLDKNGIKCFMDRKDLVPGKSYPDQITKAIKESRALILVFSANSDSSEAVQNEVGFAKNNRVPIIPVRIENVMPDKLALFITTAHWLDAFPPPVQEHFPKLVDAIKQHLSKNQEDRTQQTKVADDESAITPVQGFDY